MSLLRQRLSILAVLATVLPYAVAAAPVAHQAPVQAEKPSELVLVARQKRPRTEGVTAVVFPRGEFRKVGPRKWVESGKRAKFQFRETGDDGRMITLFDRSRNIFVYLNLRREMILWAPDGEEPRDLYPIIDVIRDAPDDGDDFGEEQDAPKVARYKCEEGIPMNVRFENRGERSLAFVSIDGSPEMRLKQVPAASGAKYSNGEYTVWTKGRNAVLEINGDSDICVGR
ncbi:MAG: MliC family protein [Rhizobium sp.]|nr:MliC family protein [Rhizobium sp.]